MIDNFLNDNSFTVSCPVCKDEYTHHQNVQTYEREYEDGITHKVNNGVRVMSHFNPSPRRNAVSILFNCESGHEFYMDIIQHKGRTFIEFDEGRGGE